jgi:hypothetical protein
MFNKRLFYYLLINVIVSAVTVLLVLSLWERAHPAGEVITPEPVSFLPTALASALPPTDSPTPRASLAETAPAADPPLTPAPAQPTATLPAPPESPQIKIVTIIGVGDLATEHVQIQSVSPDAISLTNWRLETSTGEVYTFPQITLFEYGAVDLYTRAGVNSVVALYWGRSAPVFHRGDRAVIYDTEGNVQAVYSIP